MSEFVWTEQELCDVLDGYYNVYCKTESDKMDEHIFSEKFTKRMKKLLRQAEYGPIVYKVFTQAKRVAIIVLAVLITSATLVMSVEALREKFFNWLFSVFPTHTRVEFSDVALPSGVDYADQLNQYAPTYIPEGFSLVNTVETDINYKLYYANPDEKYIVFEVNLVRDQDHTNVNTEDFELQEVSIDGNVGYYVYDGSSHLVFWSNDLYFFNILCDTTKDDSLIIAESTRKK